jgi:AcrR family transcriptional regulator
MTEGGAGVGRPRHGSMTEVGAADGRSVRSDATHQGRSPGSALSPRRPERPRRRARERILASAVGQIAREGIDGVRIARIAMDAGVSTALVHYHFDSREALLAEALEYSYAHAGDARLEGGRAGGLQSVSRAERLQAMIDSCLPTTPELEEDWVLWVELWLRAVRHPELRPVAEELYARLRAWFADEITAGVAAGEFARCDPDDVADRTLALLDGFGVRTLIGDSTIPLERACRAVSASLARDLGLGEQLVPERAVGEPVAERRAAGG